MTSRSLSARRNSLSAPRQLPALPFNLPGWHRATHQFYLANRSPLRPCGPPVEDEDTRESDGRVVNRLCGGIKVRWGSGYGETTFQPFMRTSLLLCSGWW